MTERLALEMIRDLLIAMKAAKKDSDSYALNCELALSDMIRFIESVIS